MSVYKPMYLVIITILYSSFCGKCLSDSVVHVQFITKLAQRSNEDWKNEQFEPEILEYGNVDLTNPDIRNYIKDKDIENKNELSSDNENEIKNKFDENIVKAKRIARQVGSGYSSIYPTRTTSTPYFATNPTHVSFTPRPYQGNAPYVQPSNYNSPNYTFSQNYNNTYSYPTSNTANFNTNGQSSYFRNHSNTKSEPYNRGSMHTYNSSNTQYSIPNMPNYQSFGLNNNTNVFSSKNIPYQQYNSQYSNQHHNSSLGHFNHYSKFQHNLSPMYPSNLPSQPNSANGYQFTPTTTSHYLPVYNNSRQYISNKTNSHYTPSATSTLNGSSPRYPYYPYNNNVPNSIPIYNSSTVPTRINNQPNPPRAYPQHNPSSVYPQYKPSNPFYQNFPQTNTSSQHNYNSASHWSLTSTQTPYNSQRNNYSTFKPAHNRPMNDLRQNYTTFGPVNNYYQQNFSNQWSNQNNPVANNKEPEHLFFTPGNKGQFYDPSKIPSSHFSYTQQYN